NLKSAFVSRLNSSVRPESTGRTIAKWTANSGSGGNRMPLGLVGFTVAAICGSYIVARVTIPGQVAERIRIVTRPRGTGLLWHVFDVDEECLVNANFICNFIACLAVSTAGTAFDHGDLFWWWLGAAAADFFATSAVVWFTAGPEGRATRAR